MSHPCWSLPHLPFTTSTSSSSFTLPSTTTQEHASQPVQHDHLREHPIHHAHLQALPVDKLRHQESLWREDLPSGGNPCTTTPTPNSRIRRTAAHVIFSRVAQDLSHRVNRNFLCLAKKSFSHLARHVARALVVASFTLRHYLTFPHALQSDLLSDHLPDLRCCALHTEMCPARIHRRLNRTRLQVMSRKISLKRTPLCWSNRCSSTDRV